MVATWIAFGGVIVNTSCTLSSYTPSGVESTSEISITPYELDAARGGRTIIVIKQSKGHPMEHGQHSIRSYIMRQKL